MRLRIDLKAALILLCVLALTASTVAASHAHEDDFAGRVCQICHFGPAPHVQVGQATGLPPLAVLGWCGVPTDLAPSFEPVVHQRLPRAPPA